MKPSFAPFAALVAVALVGQTTVGAWECPTDYTFTSDRCSEWCTGDPTETSDSCVLFPATGEYPCASSSVGYCMPTSSPGCSVKCINNRFFIRSPTGNTLTLGLRGKTGSFGRAERIDRLDGLKLDTVTAFNFKDYMIENGSPPAHRITVDGTGLEASALTSMELDNVLLSFGVAPTLPSTLTTLTLHNNNLVAPSANVIAQDNSSSAFPTEIFTLKSLRQLDIRQNPKLTAAEFTAEQLSFFRQLEKFDADFQLPSA